MRGLLVAVEGIDNSGKTTVVSMLRKSFESQGIAVSCSREPGDNPVGQVFREVSRLHDLDRRVAALLSTADRYWKCEDLARRLEGGELVISDRYYLSGLAYHLADGIALEDYAALNQEALKPSLYLFLDIPFKTCMALPGFVWVGVS